MKEVDLLELPFLVRLTHRVKSGTVHTFVLRCESSHQFIGFTNNVCDRASILAAFSRCDEIENAGEDLIVRCSGFLEAVRHTRLQYMKQKKKKQ